MNYALKFQLQIDRLRDVKAVWIKDNDWLLDMSSEKNTTKYVDKES